MGDYRDAIRSPKLTVSERMKLAKRFRRKIAALKVWKREGLKLRPKYIELRKPKEGDGFTYGRAARTGYVVVGMTDTPEYMAQVILHEMTHVAMFRLRRPKRNGHGPAFRGLLLAASEELWGIDRVEDNVLELWEKQKGTMRVHAYDLDFAVATVARTRRIAGMPGIVPLDTTGRPVRD